MATPNHLAWESAYNTTRLQPSDPPIVVISAEATAYFRDIASLRTKGWKSSNRTTSNADGIGLLGEIAASIWAGITAPEAMGTFVAGLKSDGGWDLCL